jgi:hypothetical protein
LRAGRISTPDLCFILSDIASIILCSVRLIKISGCNIYIHLYRDICYLHPNNTFLTWRARLYNISYVEYRYNTGFAATFFLIYYVFLFIYFIFLSPQGCIFFEKKKTIFRWLYILFFRRLYTYSNSQARVYVAVYIYIYIQRQFNNGADPINCRPCGLVCMR